MPVKRLSDAFSVDDATWDPFCTNFGPQNDAPGPQKSKKKLGAVLEAFREVLERSWRHIRGVLEAYKRRLGAVLGPVEAMLEPSGGQKAPQMEPDMVPNRAPEGFALKTGKPDF